MIEKMAYWITLLLIKKKHISPAEKELYTYSMELLLSTTINLLLILIIGAYYHKIFETIIFLVIFCTLKRYTGGLHLSSYRKCIIFFILLYITLLTWNKYFLFFSYTSFFRIVILSLVPIYFLSPIENSKKKLSKLEKEALSIKVHILLFVHTFLFIVFYFSNISYVFSFIGLAIIVTSFLVTTGYIQNFKEV